jgi:hypothetical protein
MFFFTGSTISFITRVCGFQKLYRSTMKEMVGCVKALSILVRASVGSMDDFQSVYHHENGKRTPNELTFPPKNYMRSG